MSDFTRCAECDKRVKTGEYHPHLFCVLYKGGIKNPAGELASLGYERSQPKVSKVSWQRASHA